MSWIWTRTTRSTVSGRSSAFVRLDLNAYNRQYGSGRSSAFIRLLFFCRKKIAFHSVHVLVSEDGDTCMEIYRDRVCCFFYSAAARALRFCWPSIPTAVSLWRVLRPVFLFVLFCFVCLFASCGAGQQGGQTSMETNRDPHYSRNLTWAASSSERSRKNPLYPRG